MAGYLSFLSRGMMPNSGILWDIQQPRPVSVNKLVLATDRGHFETCSPNPWSPDARSLGAPAALWDQRTSCSGFTDNPVPARLRVWPP